MSRDTALWFSLGFLLYSAGVFLLGHWLGWLERGKAGDE